MWRRGRRTVERIEATGARQRRADAIGCREVRLLPHDAAARAREEVARRHGSAVRIEERSPRAVGAESLDLIGHDERSRERAVGRRCAERGCGRRRRHAESGGSGRMAPRLPHRGVLQPAPVGGKTDEARCGTGAADHHQPRIGPSRHQLNRILRSRLQVGGRCNHGSQRRVEAKEVIVVGGCADRIGPVHRDGRPGGHDGVADISTTPHQRVAGAGNDRRQRAGNEIAFPRTCGALRNATGIAGGGKIQCAVGHHVIDRLHNQCNVGVRWCGLAIVQSGFDEIEDVVDDDVAFGGDVAEGSGRRGNAAQRADIVGEIGQAVERRGEIDACAGHEVVHDLDHRATLVAAAAGQVAGPREAHRVRIRERCADARQVAKADIRGGRAEIVEAVGNDPDARARAVEPEGAAHIRRAMRNVALRRDGSDIEDDITRPVFPRPRFAGSGHRVLAVSRGSYRRRHRRLEALQPRGEHRRVNHAARARRR